MTKWLLTTLLLLFCNMLIAQNSYMVTYKYITSPGDNRKIQLVLNDTVSYWYLDKKGVTPKRKDKDLFGEVNIHHSCFFFPNQNKIYSMMSSDKRQPYMFIVDPVFRAWQANPDEREIEGYSCKSALSINGKGDSLLVYYTDILPYRASPLFNYSDIPGVVMEAYDQERGLHFVATKVTPGNYRIVFPAGIEILSQDERNKRVMENNRKRNVEFR